MKKEMKCNLCGDKLNKFLDLGLQPLANKYPKKEDFDNESFFPLNVLFCENCKNLDQLLFFFISVYR